jgi:hypothetical protein
MKVLDELSPAKRPPSRGKAGKEVIRTRSAAQKRKGRSIPEIDAAIEELFSAIWYDRHQRITEELKAGQRDIWERAQQAASKIEKRYRVENLGPWNDFEWGMLNGKLSALRWVMGDYWDNLGT